MTSAGFGVPPLPAIAVTDICIDELPNILAKNSGTSVCCLTTMPFAASEPEHGMPVLVKHRSAG